MTETDFQGRKGVRAELRPSSADAGERGDVGVDGGVNAFHAVGGNESSGGSALPFVGVDGEGEACGGDDGLQIDEDKIFPLD